MNEGGEALMTSIPASDHAFELVQPSKQALDLPAAFISAQRTPVLSCRSGTIASMRCNQANASGCESLIERIAVIGTIPDKSSGSSQREGLIEGRFDKGDFMWTSRIRVHGEWKTMSICNHHELRTFAALGFSHFVAPFFATEKVPSMKHSSRSIWPRFSRCRARSSNILRNTPVLTHTLKRRKQVEPEGKRFGRSAQPAPVRNTHKTPFNTARSLCLIGRPRPSARRDGGGIIGSTIAHCSSVNSSRLLMTQN
jgi:hypothetical protein